MLFSGHQKTRAITFTALLAAFIAILSQIIIPLPVGVPVTMQVFAIAFCGFYSPVCPVVPVAVYILAGVVGAPVFAGFRGGAATLFSPTGGFIIGFLMLALFCGLSRKRGTFGQILLSGIGLIACHLCGCAVFSLVTECTFLTALYTASLPFLLKDAVSVALAFFAVRLLNKRYRLCKTKI